MHLGEMNQKPAEQGRILAGRDRQKEVGILRGRRAPRVDDDDPCPALGSVLHHPLEQHRMAPRGVRADEHDQVCFVEVVVCSRYGVGSECAALAGHRRRHAQARIRIHIGRADEALHQLVGDVIVLGQHLPREIKRNRAGTVARDDMLKTMRDMVERIAPGHPLHVALAAADHRMKQPALKSEGLAERRTLRAQPPEIRGMLGVARDRRAAAVIGRRQYAAADAAIGTGGARGAQRSIDGGHVNNPATRSRRLRRPTWWSSSHP